VTLDITFRVDASTSLGFGHLSRCLVLADAFGRLGATCVFLTRPRDGSFLSEIERKGHKVVLLPQRADDRSFFGVTEEQEVEDVLETLETLCRVPDWLVVDHYGATEMWHRALRRNCNRLMVIDDLADRAIDADLILNQNLYANPSDYKDLTKGAHLLAGAAYSLLRPEFKLTRPKALARRRSPGRRVLVSLGGGDPSGLTVPIVSALTDETPLNATSLCIVLGLAAAASMPDVEKLLKGFPGDHQVVLNAQNMAELMAESDLCIGAAGSSAWERCCLGLPSLTFVLAENQFPAARALSKIGASIEMNSNAVPMLKLLVDELLLDPARLRDMAKRAAGVTDGCGVDRVIQSMLDF